MDKNERKITMTAALNLPTTGFTRQERFSSSLDSGLRLSNYRGAETGNWDCHQAAEDTSGVLFDENSDGNSFDFYVGVASAVGLSLVLVVAAVAVVSLWRLI
jgi:hypothetical protein